MVVAGTGLLENRRAPATTLEGWRSFIRADPSELALLPTGQWEALDERDRRDYDEARIAHHAELVVVTTSAIAEITSEGQLLVLMNQREIGARRGLIVSGDAATGKTTSIKQLGRLHELRVRARFPAGRDRIPVVYVTCPPKGLAAQAGHGVRPLPRPGSHRRRRHRHSRYVGTGAGGSTKRSASSPASSNAFR
jgi:hypothetical protein